MGFIQESCPFVLCTSLALKSDGPVNYKCASHIEDLLGYLKCRQDLCDVVLIVGPFAKRIAAHRLILIAASDYFSTLLSDSTQTEVTLGEVNEAALENLINFSYSGVLQLEIESIETLITTAKLLQFKRVVGFCCEFLQSSLQPSNCFSIAFFAKQWNFQTLEDECRKFIYQNFVEVSKCPEFLQLTAKHLSEMLASDDLDVPSEEVAFDVLMTWIEHEPEKRMKDFSELLSTVRLPLLSPTFLIEKVEPLCTEVKSKKLLLNAMKSQLAPNDDNRVQMRNCFGSFLLAFYSNREKAIIAGYNPHKKTWTAWETPIEERINYGVVLLNEDLIFIGGYSNDYEKYLNSVVRLHLRTMALSHMPPLERRRAFHTAAILNGAIYVFGGTGGDEAINSVERLDPGANSWYYVTPMNIGRISPISALFNGCLYVAGGTFESKNLSSVECYDPLADTWTYKASLRKERYDLVVHMGHLYAVGGRRKDLTENLPIERYDPEADAWTAISYSSSPCVPRGCLRSASLASHVYILGRFDFYMLSTDANSGGNMELQVLPKPKNTTQVFCFLPAPNGVTLPDSWLQKDDHDSLNASWNS